MMRALTLIRPWCWAIAHAGKDIENRTWQPPESIFGKRIAIHSGLKRDDEARAFIGRVTGRIDEVPLERPAPGAPPGRVWPGGRIVATAVIDGTIAVKHGTPLAGLKLSPWFVGPVGWLLRDVRVLREPVPCRGAQGLWTLPWHPQFKVGGYLLTGEQSQNARILSTKSRASYPAGDLASCLRRGFVL